MSSNRCFIPDIDSSSWFLNIKSWLGLLYNWPYFAGQDELNGHHIVNANTDSPWLHSLSLAVQFDRHSLRCLAVLGQKQVHVPLAVNQVNGTFYISLVGWHSRNIYIFFICLGIIFSISCKLQLMSGVLFIESNSNYALGREQFIRVPRGLVTRNIHRWAILGLKVLVNEKKN